MCATHILLVLDTCKRPATSIMIDRVIICHLPVRYKITPHENGFDCWIRSTFIIWINILNTINSIQELSILTEIWFRYIITVIDNFVLFSSDLCCLKVIFLDHWSKITSSSLTTDLSWRNLAHGNCFPHTNLLYRKNKLHNCLHAVQNDSFKCFRFDFMILFRCFYILLQLIVITCDNHTS